jgi:2-isopropylmalate synthase
MMLQNPSSKHHLFEHDSGQSIRLTLEMNGASHLLTGEGNGPIDAAVHALQGIVTDFKVRDYQEHAMGRNADARACAFIAMTQADSHREYFGVGIDTNIVTASIKALVSGINRLSGGLAVAAWEFVPDNCAR